MKSRFDPELALIIQLALYKLSVWDSGATYGAKLQDLRYRVPSTPGTVLTGASPILPWLPRNTHPNTNAAAGLPRSRLLLHGFLTVLVPYIHTRLRNNAMSNAWPEAPSSDRRRKLWDWMTSIESTHTALSLVSFVVFLWNGRCAYLPPHRSMLTDYIALYRYRTLTDRLLQMPLVPARKLIKRNVSYEFMNRQMVWHAFTVSDSRVYTVCMASYISPLRLGIPYIHSPANKYSYPSPPVRPPRRAGEANILDLASAFSQQTFTNTTT